jgi:acyl-CoA synthetase (AMP-forming)/AMP-acid ligase II
MGRLLHHGLVESARHVADHPAVLAGESTWTFADLDRLSDAFARRLPPEGVGPGRRVIVMTSNRVEFVVAVHGISKAGAASVLVNPGWKTAEVRHALRLTEPVLAVADGLAVEVMRELVPILDLDDLDDLDDLEVDAASDPIGEPVGDGAESVLVFSSGTTGMPKAVRHTHRSILRATGHWVASLALTGEDRFQIATPPTHILGLLNLLAAAEVGATVRLHARFDLDELLRRIESDRMTLEMAVAPIALAMANHPSIEDYDLSSLRYIVWGATPVTESVARTVTRRTGVRWLPGYGASEVPVISCNPVHEPDRWRLDSAGLPPAGVELRVADLETGESLPDGSTGEIQVRSASAMAGYLPDEATADAFADGWYRTGDVGWLEPGGWVHLTDRAKEMIKVNGFQVAPAEVEAILLGHAAVLDCAVFGIPDERAGEVPVAAVQLDPDVPVGEHELRELVADALATYKQVRHVVVVDQIPRLPSGKALRRVLRDQWAVT